jgi:non-ribosomal peptide synthetase component F
MDTEYGSSTSPRLLHHLVRASMERGSPDSLAVEAWDGSFTNRDFTTLTRQIASALRAEAVVRGSIVPLLFEKSRWMPVAACAILEAGAAFVSLDINHPLERHRTILEQIKPSIAVVSCEASKRFESHGLKTLVVGPESDFSAWDQREKTVRDDVTEADPAYLLYTSGTTGKPKGVVVRHEAIAHSCLHVAKQLGFGAESKIRSFQWASYAFDAWILDTFFTLANGGCVCIPSEFQRLNDIPRTMRALRVTHALFTPSVAGQISPEEVPSLEQLMMGGEKASEEVARTWRGKAKVLNLYGPTEVRHFAQSQSISQG